MNRWRTSLVTIGVAVILLTLGVYWHNGLEKGQKNSTSTTVTTGQQAVFQDSQAAQYEGKANLAKYEAEAKANLNSTEAQINAARSAYVNGDNQKGIFYYQAASKLDPSNGKILAYIGNIYMRGIRDPKSALPYYTKATQIEPSYDYGWWNLAICQQYLGDNSAVKATLVKGLAVLPKNDPLVPQLQKMLDELK